MNSLSQFLQTGDWKGEKHVPIIHCPEKVKAGEGFELKISVGDEIKHPNTAEHHISWFKVFFHGKDDKFPVEIGDFKFTAHGEGNVYDEPIAVTHIKLNKSGTIYALSYCNIHGLWENSKEIVVE
ncbi:superoxide reductase [Caminicella sporogenes DSM 14501]|uniref:Superoxide reductase n=1 Tax=Caminicella sporogenes DSM 14501 TaxID=1121266 RepID=A0A1M6KZK1_9FIRM|nr:class II SORL domain-containing protein [Caminicella sporogenes]RKD27653.1 superoxide reductase [Caminicella sporogenes]WIF94772.1 class II SORL domain-containing protein [Caminicella sporogenes]SHJ64296.1 superoxide reductase [Caminicella sporogenes DSM 14501]